MKWNATNCIWCAFSLEKKEEKEGPYFQFFIFFFRQGVVQKWNNWNPCCETRHSVSCVALSVLSAAPANSENCTFSMAFYFVQKVYTIFYLFITSMGLPKWASLINERCAWLYSLCNFKGTSCSHGIVLFVENVPLVFKIYYTTYYWNVTKLEQSLASVVLTFVYVLVVIFFFTRSFLLYPSPNQYAATCSNAGFQSVAFIEMHNSKFMVYWSKNADILRGSKLSRAILSMPLLHYGIMYLKSWARFSPSILRPKYLTCDSYRHISHYAFNCYILHLYVRRWYSRVFQCNWHACIVIFCSQINWVHVLTVYIGVYHLCTTTGFRILLKEFCCASSMRCFFNFHTFRFLPKEMIPFWR